MQILRPRSRGRRFSGVPKRVGPKRGGGVVWGDWWIRDARPRVSIRHSWHVPESVRGRTSLIVQHVATTPHVESSGPCCHCPATVDRSRRCFPRPRDISNAKRPRYSQMPVNCLAMGWGDIRSSRHLPSAGARVGHRSSSNRRGCNRRT